MAEAFATGERLTVLSYNIHGCVGGDDRRDVNRIAAVLRDLDADIIALQEVLNHPGEPGEAAQVESLAQALGMQAISGPILMRGCGGYGNALLSRHRPTDIRRIDLSFPEREPRGALDVDIAVGGNRLRVIATHLGLRPAERRFQVRRLVQAADKREDSMMILMGDLNEWLPWGRPARWMRRHFGTGPAPPTFPSVFPLFSLDRIIVRPREALKELRAIRSPRTRIASDHLPLVAVLAPPGFSAGSSWKHAHIVHPKP